MADGRGQIGATPDDEGWDVEKIYSLILRRCPHYRGCKRDVILFFWSGCDPDLLHGLSAEEIADHIGGTKKLSHFGWISS